MNRKRKGLCAALAVFALLVIVKFAFPGFGAGLRREAERVFNMDGDYRQVFSLFRERGEPEPEPTETPKESLKPVEAAHAEAIRPVFLEGSSAGEKLPELQPAAVAAFLASQEEYAYLELPDKVSYDYVKLPFDFCVPVNGYSSSGFGYRLHPILGYVKFHYGTDIAANTGESVLAFAAGKVTRAEYSDSFGYYITIDHGEGWQSLYAHCSSLLVSAGAEVEAGEKIALVGATGRVTGPHLHFELTDGGVYLNPEYYING